MWSECAHAEDGDADTCTDGGAHAKTGSDVFDGDVALTVPDSVGPSVTSTSVTASIVMDVVFAALLVDEVAADFCNGLD
jgi:hypothetical protein